MKRDPIVVDIKQVVHLDAEDVQGLQVETYYTIAAGKLKPHVVTGGYLTYRWSDRRNAWHFDGGSLDLRLIKKDGELYAQPHSHMLWPYSVASEHPALVAKHMPTSTVIVGVTE